MLTLLTSSVLYSSQLRSQD